MDQMGFSCLEYGQKRRQTRRETFLAELDALIPWADLEALIEPYYPRRGKGRNVVERSHNRLKDFRRIATRYDRLAITFFSAVCLAATFAYWL